MPSLQLSAKPSPFTIGLDSPSLPSIHTSHPCIHSCIHAFSYSIRNCQHQIRTNHSTICIHLIRLPDPALLTADLDLANCLTERSIDYCPIKSFSIYPFFLVDPPHEPTPADFPSNLHLHIIPGISIYYFTHAPTEWLVIPLDRRPLLHTTWKTYPTGRQWEDIMVTDEQIHWVKQMRLVWWWWCWPEGAAKGDLLVFRWERFPQTRWWHNGWWWHNEVRLHDEGYTYILEFQ